MDWLAVADQMGVWLRQPSPCGLRLLPELLVICFFVGVAD